MKHISISFLILLGISSCNAQSSYAPKTQTGTSQSDTSVPKVRKDITAEQSQTSSTTEISLSQLKGTKWKILSPVADDEESTWEFTDCQVIEKTFYKNSNDRFDFTFPYYLSDSRPIPFYDNNVSQAKFNENLVGKNPKGSFIVMYNDKMDDINWYTIRSFNLETDDMCLFRECRGEFGVGDVTIHLKLISKSAGSTGSHGGGKR